MTQSAPEPKATPSTLRSAEAWLTLASITLLGLLIDLYSKWLAFERIAGFPVHVRREDVLAASAAGQNLGSLIPPHEPIVVIPRVLEFTLVLNPGAVFGVGAGRRWFFVLFTLGALALALWMFAAWTKARDRRAHIALGLLIAGGLGNLYDRLAYASVRDFIHPLPGVQLPFGWHMPLSGGREIWPYVSNLADLWLLIGIGLLMWFLWRHSESHAEVQRRREKQETSS